MGRKKILQVQKRTALNAVNCICYKGLWITLAIQLASWASDRKRHAKGVRRMRWIVLCGFIPISFSAGLPFV